VNYDATLLSYFLHASMVVKCVMLILAVASVFSWGYIFERYAHLKEIQKSSKEFEKAFWSGENLSKLYSVEERKRGSLEGMEAIFHAGFKEFSRFRQTAGVAAHHLIDNTKRAMHVAQMREHDQLETHLSFLSIVASTSPYVGLFGTVWGIMQAFRALANVQQATIAMVAPGIAEALIATALGLFAAIPAVIAYNRFVAEIGRLMNRFDAFQEELINILIRESHKNASSLETVEP
jgi:biopolymer transport protein TolQ